MAGIFDRITGSSDGDVNGSAETGINNGHVDIDRDIDQDETRGDDATDHGEDIASAGEADRTDRTLRDAAQELLRLGLLEQSQRPNLYRAAVVSLERLNAILEPLDLKARVDDIRGLVFLAVRHAAHSTQPEPDASDEQDDWSHPLVRKQRLNLEQTLLVAILRQHFIAHEQDAGVGAADAMVAVDDLVPQLQLYLGDSGSEGRERSRVVQLLDQLKGHGLVSAPDSHERVVIRPMIAHLANPETLTALLHALKKKLAEADEDTHDAEGAG